ncbi:MAG: glycoside hydrolase family 15 protein [Deltaproteobacteria bacterium]|nr:glycoside hydrolase family 15 protein [Deltaproteobacteria bacterium]
MRYGMIGNCKTAALVHESGKIEWCCLPNFDSPSVFASLLDPQGGHFQVGQARPSTVQQSYLPQTNILQTEFIDGDNAFAVIDFMPRYREGEVYRHPIEIHRLLKPLRGHPIVQILFHPALNYAQGETQIQLYPHVISATHDVEDIYLYSSLPLEGVLAGAHIPLTRDEFLLLTYHEKMELPTLGYTYEMFEKTKTYWEGWSQHCRLPTLAQDAVLRSALALKLMTFQETGAIIAAPTTSLPEILGEERNWDYRYCWLRDSSLMLEALKSIGHFEEARAFIHFLLEILESKKTKIQIVYGINGRTHLEEKTLLHLSGYKNSKPVRIGNYACNTQQNDIYGEVLNTIYLYFFHYQFEKITDDVWSLVKFLVNTIGQKWCAEDAGIWEYRFHQAHFTFSKVLAWVALDRGSRIAEKLGRPHTAKNWQIVAEKIKVDILRHGWNPAIQAFTQSYGSADLDVGVLLMHRYGFLTADDPQWISTVKQCERFLLKDGFGFRYTASDDFGPPRSSFIMATFWIIKALYSIGEQTKALALFEKALAQTNHLGLLSEDIDPKTSELLGNFPQAFSHMALINTAHLLDKRTL